MGNIQTYCLNYNNQYNTIQYKKNNKIFSYKRFIKPNSINLCPSGILIEIKCNHIKIILTVLYQICF